MTELEEKILKDIQKTGFAAELNAVSILIANGWDTRHSETYEDKDENKSREIDIIASKSKYEDEYGFRFNFYLVIEVKKTEKPWIVFSTTKEMPCCGWRLLHNGINCRIKKQYAGRNTVESIFDVGCITPNDPRTNILRIGKAFHEFSKQPNEKSKIYEALMTSCKAAKYFCSLRADMSFGDFKPDQETELNIYLPIVILDGSPLFEVHNNYNGEIRIEEKKHIPIEMSYSSPNYKGGGWDLSFLPDIITLDNLKEHLDLLEKWRTSVLSSCSLALKEVGKQPYTTPFA